MKKLGLVVLVLAFLVTGNRASNTSVVGPKQSAATAATQQLVAQSHPPVLQVPAQPASPPISAASAVLDPAIPLPEPAWLMLMGSSLITAGVVARRRLRRF